MSGPEARESVESAQQMPQEEAVRLYEELNTAYKAFDHNDLAATRAIHERMEAEPDLSTILEDNFKKAEYLHERAYVRYRLSYLTYLDKYGNPNITSGGRPAFSATQLTSSEAREFNMVIATCKADLEAAITFWSAGLRENHESDLWERSRSSESLLSTITRMENDLLQASAEATTAINKATGAIVKRLQTPIPGKEIITDVSPFGGHIEINLVDMETGFGPIRNIFLHYQSDGSVRLSVDAWHEDLPPVEELEALVNGN